MAKLFNPESKSPEVANITAKPLMNYFSEINKQSDRGTHGITRTHTKGIYGRPQQPRWLIDLTNGPALPQAGAAAKQ